jgi:hypothetical protein
VLAISGWFLIARQHFAVDFTIYWTAARDAWGPVYDTDWMTRAQAWVHDTGPRPFVYPPSFLLLILPLGLLPLQAAFSAYVAVSGAALVEAGARLEPRFPIILVASVLGVEAWGGGQATVFVAAALFAGVSLLEKRPRLAGLMFGAALAMKPQVVFAVVPALAVWRFWPALFATIASFGVLSAASAALFGPDIWLRWLALVRELPAVSLATRGVVGISLGWGMSGAPYVAVRAVGILAAAWLIWRARRGPELAWLLGIAGGSLLCSPYLMRYEVLTLAPVAIGFLFSRSWRIVPGALLLLGFILVWWLMAAFIAVAALELRFWRAPAPRLATTPTS